VTRIGPAGWAYKDWWGIVYPARKTKDLRELSYLAGYFDTLEINVSFYRPLTPKMAEAWVKQVEGNAQFRFTAKLWRGFTHDRNATASDRQLFLDGIAPLKEGERLGALLLQFPWSFRNTDENRSYVLKLAHEFRELPLVLEVRHGSWAAPGCWIFWLSTRSACATSINRDWGAVWDRVRSRRLRSATCGCTGGTIRAGLQKTSLLGSATTICYVVHHITDASCLAILTHITRPIEGY
jgi:uncharacterized protein YecE (DUF72 family)